MTFRNLQQSRVQATALMTKIHTFTITGFQQWRRQNADAVNLLLLLPLKILLALQIRVGCMSSLHLVDVTNNLAITKLNVYPTVTYDTGPLSLTDVMFISEANRVTRFVPKNLGYILTKAYEGRINLLSKHTRPNNFFNELTGHVNTDMNKAMVNEWEFYQLPDLDITNFATEEFSNITNMLKNHRLRSQLLQQAAPLNRYCHVWTTKNKKEQQGKQNLVNLVDWDTIRTRYKNVQVSAQFSCIGEIDQYGNKECGFSGLTVTSINKTGYQQLPRKNILQSETTPTKPVAKRGILQVGRNPRVLFKELPMDRQVPNLHEPLTKKNRPMSSSESDSSQQDSPGDKTPDNLESDLDIDTQNYGNPPLCSTKITEPAQRGNMPGDDPQPSTSHAESNFMDALTQLRQEYENKYVQTRDLLLDIEKGILEAPATIIPTVAQAAAISDQINLLAGTIRDGHNTAEELRDMLQHSIMSIIQNVFATHVEIPKPSQSNGHQKLLTSMALKYLDNLNGQVIKQRPFPMPKYFTGQTQSYADEYQTVMNEFNNQTGQLFESLLTEIRQTKRIIENLDQKTQGQSGNKKQKSTQELLESQSSQQSTPSPIIKSNSRGTRITQTSAASSKTATGWTFSNYSRNTISEQGNLNDTFFESNRDIEFNTPPRASTNLPNIRHRQLPEWVKSNKIQKRSKNHK